MPTKLTKIGSKIRFFVIFSSLVYYFSFKFYRMIAWKFASSVFYDIAQDSSLGQCVPPSRAEISKKKKRFVAQIRT